MSGSVAESGALSGSVTERNSGQVNVRVGVSSDKFEETSEDVASVVAHGAEFGAASVGVADEEFDQKCRDLKESVEERSSNNTAPVFAYESLVGLVARGVPSPVPVNSTA